MERSMILPMWRLALAAAMAVALVWIVCGDLNADDLTARVRWVVDGDTIILDTGQTVRLLGINAPELSRDDQPGQYYAQQARQQALELMHGAEVLVQTSRTDRFQRLVGTVHLPDGTLVNKALVQGGAAFVSHYSHPEQRSITGLVEVQRRAMQDEVGFWDTILSLPQATGPFVGHRRSLRFHTPECAFGQAIHDRNRRRFLTLEQAFRAGFAPGRCCTLWPTRTEVLEGQEN
ncbi:MAG: thermonuclease family protein [Desulfovermiculus sp.]|nr:thermonuclease family protein [Desulfovermiculus sp.]